MTTNIPKTWLGASRNACLEVPSVGETHKLRDLSDPGRQTDTPTIMDESCADPVAKCSNDIVMAGIVYDDNHVPGRAWDVSLRHAHVGLLKTTPLTHHPNHNQDPKATMSDSPVHTMYPPLTTTPFPSSRQPAFVPEPATLSTPTRTLSSSL